MPDKPNPKLFGITAILLAARNKAQEAREPESAAKEGERADETKDHDNAGDDPDERD